MAGWFSAAVSKIQSSIEEATKEFEQEQEKYCDPEQKLTDVPAITPPPSGAAAADVFAAAAADPALTARKATESVLQLGASLSALLVSQDGKPDEAVDSSNAVLPWEKVSLAPHVREKVKHLSQSAHTFQNAPPEFVNFHFTMAEELPVIMRMLEEDKQMSNQRFQLVPKIVSEHDFFRNYFYNVSLVESEALLDSQPHPSPQPATNTMEHTDMMALHLMMQSPTPPTPQSAADNAFHTTLLQEPTAHFNSVLASPSALLHQQIADDAEPTYSAPSDEYGTNSSDTFEFISDEYLNDENMVKLKEELKAELGPRANQAVPGPAQAAAATSSEGASWEDELKAELEG